MDQRAAGYHFLKNGGMGYAKKLEKLTAEDLAAAAAARILPENAGLKSLNDNTVPGVVRDAITATRKASMTVVGTDGRRELCRHEGVAYMETFGPPLLS